MKKTVPVLAIAFLLGYAAWAAGADVPNLFTILPGEVASVSPAALTAVPVAVNTAVLEAGPASLRLHLPDGPVVDARLTDLERRGPGDIAWRGRIENGHRGVVTLTLKHGFVVGLVSLTEGSWEFRTQPAGGQSLERLDAERFPACGTPQPMAVRGFTGDEPDPCPNPVNPPTQIDVLGYYTPQARDAAGGVAQIEALVQAAVDLSNTVFGNSEMTARFRLADAELSTRNDSGDMQADLNWLWVDPGVAAYRNEVKADLVSLIVEDGGGSCGIAKLPTFWSDPPANEGLAFQVTARTCAVGNLSFPHEHGHNMGLEHDPAHGSLPPFGTYPFRYGHFVSNPTDQARTVMSYSNLCGQGCPRMPYFSNPEIDFPGTSEPTGIIDARDNHRAGNLTDACISDYRINSLIFTDGFESGGISAWTSTVP